MPNYTLVRSLSGSPLTESDVKGTVVSLGVQTFYREGALAFANTNLPKVTAALERLKSTRTKLAKRTRKS